MLKSLARYEYVEEALAEYVPAKAQGVPLALHNVEVLDGVITSDVYKIKTMMKK